jgi:hypothetical protein
VIHCDFLAPFCYDVSIVIPFLPTAKMHVVESVAALASEIADIGNIKFQFGDYSTPVGSKLIS